MAQYINIFVILVNLECRVTHFYYEGWDNIYIYIYVYICVYIKFVINLCITWTWTDEHAANLNMKQRQKFHLILLHQASNYIKMPASRCNPTKLASMVKVNFMPYNMRVITSLDLHREL